MPRTSITCAALTLLAVALPAAAAAQAVIEIPRTGQAACYDLAGDEIACDFTGQDGCMLAGAPWPAARFVDNGDGTVTDAMTGLMWTADAALGGSGLTWEEAIGYAAALTVGGHDDWRLPNINELASLVDAGAADPALPGEHPFANVQPDYYWSSTSAPLDTLYAWAVDLYGGSIDKMHKPNIGQFIWPVRVAQPAVPALPRTGQDACYDADNNVIGCEGTGQDGQYRAGAAWPGARLQDNRDGTVTDLLTGLMWSADANPAGTSMTWREALDYVSTLTIAGYDDWRLPNRKELRSLVDYTHGDLPLSRSPPFENALGSLYWGTLYWTSTSHAGPFVHNFAWTVDMEGIVYPDTKPSRHCVWPVRSGRRGGDNATALTVIPKKVHRLPAFLRPVRCFLLAGPAGSAFQRDFRVHWSDAAVTPLARVRLGRRLILAMVFIDPFGLEPGRCRVNVDYCRGGFEITQF